MCVLRQTVFLQFTEDQIKAKPDNNFRTMLFRAEVDLTVVDIFRAQDVRSCGTFDALADSDTDFKDSPVGTCLREQHSFRFGNKCRSVVAGSFTSKAQFVLTVCHSLTLST